MFWDNVSDNTVDMSVGEYYQKFAANMKATTPEGYTCDPLAPSPIVFLGSCDMSGPIPDPTGVWSRVMYREFSKTLDPFPYIGLSRVHSAMGAAVRRLYAYCEKFGPPKKVFLVMPRPVCIEIPIRGTLVNISERNQYPEYLARIGLITQSELESCLKFVEFSRTQKDNPEYHLYRFEEIGAFLKLICERYQIEFSWTPNLAVAAVDYFSRWLPLFLENDSFMAKTCVGVAEVVDFAADASTGQKTQSTIADLFLSSDEPHTMDRIKAQLDANKRYLVVNHAEAYSRSLRLQLSKHTT